MPFPSLPGAAGAASSPAMPVRSRRVVDAPTRVFHALFALCFLGAYLTSEGETLRLLHVTLGYSMAGLLAFRLVYGLLGPRQARLALLWRKLSGLPQWLALLRQGVSDRCFVAVNWRQGQNLALAVAVAVLLALGVPLTLSGYASYNEWGDWLGEVHALIGNTFLAVVLVHVGVVVVLSLLRRKNLALQMVHGRTEGPGPDLVQHNHTGLALLLVVAVLAFWGWQWQQSPQGLVSPQAMRDVLQWPALDESDDD